MGRRPRLSWRAPVWFAFVAGGLACFAIGVMPVCSKAADDAAKVGASEQKGGPSVGCPLAAGMMELLEDEIATALKDRGMAGAFARFKEYAAATLSSTANSRGSWEIGANCRLKWYARLLRDPSKAPAEAERFTRKLHQTVIGGPDWLDRTLVMAGEKLDLKISETATPAQVKSPEEAIDAVKQCLEKAMEAHGTAVAPLSQTERNLLQSKLYSVLTEEVEMGHTLVNRPVGRQLLDLLENKVDRSAMLDAARSLSVLARPEVLEQLRKLPDEGSVAVEGATGPVLRRIETSAGSIVIAGKGNNTYDLEKMAGVCAVIDLGGDDEYLQGTVSLQRPLMVLIDLDGNDKYTASKQGAQGGAVLGVSMLLDLAGDDVYRARDVAQGSCVGGVGILVDYAGDDVYAGIRRVQGQAIGGIGLLIDRGGQDRYHAVMWAQGFGGPLGFALLDDLDGDDYYFAGGLYPDTYPETPGYDAWSQGVGAGLRQVSNGGIGVILDGAGDDVYEFDYMGHGGGYWLGVGLARDFGGNDRRRGATRTAFDGNERTQARFQRFGTGFGCHYALGFCFDDAGDDTYGGNIMGLGFGWDLSVGVLCDFGGNDRYEASGQHTQGSGAQASLGIIFDYEGNDVYLGQGQGYASPSISYHSMPSCGGNFGFVIDYGGKDQYGCGAKNNAYTVRGGQGGFVIDRPKQEELDPPGKPASGTKHPSGEVPAVSAMSGAAKGN